MVYNCLSSPFNKKDMILGLSGKDISYWKRPLLLCKSNSLSSPFSQKDLFGPERCVSNGALMSIFFSRYFTSFLEVHIVIYKRLYLFTFDHKATALSSLDSDMTLFICIYFDHMSIRIGPDYHEGWQVV